MATPQNLPTAEEKRSELKSIGDKIVSLLMKTGDSILADLKDEFGETVFFTDQVAVSDGSVSAAVDDWGKFIDLVFMKIGIDFSDAASLQAFGERLVETIKKIEQLADTIQAATDVDGTDAAEVVTNLLPKLIPLVQELIDLVQEFSAAEVQNLSYELGDTLAEVDVKALLKRIVEYAVITLLKNAREVFADEIEMVRLKVELLKDTVQTSVQEFEKEIGKAREAFDQAKREAEKTYQELRREADEVRQDTLSAFNTICSGLEEAAGDVETLVEGVRQEARVDALRLMERLKTDGSALEKLFDKHADAFATIARAFNITYSILDFLGIIRHKQMVITVPRQVIKAMRCAKDSVAGVLSNADSKLVAIASGLDDDIRAFGSDLDAKATEQARAAVDVLDSAASSVGSNYEVLQSASSRLSEISGTLGISQANIQTAQLQLALVAGGLDTAEADLAKKYGELKEAVEAVYNGTADDVKAAHERAKQLAGEIGEKADDFIDRLENLSYTVEYITLDLSKTKQLFTHPVKHFKQLYPIDSLDDAKALAKRVMEIMHLVNPDIPSFDSLMNMLETLLKRLKDRLLQLVRQLGSELENSAKQLKEKAIRLIKPLIDKVEAVINFLRGIATELKGEMMQVVENVKLVMNTVGKNLETVANSYYKQLTILRDTVEDNLEAVGSQIDDARKQAERRLVCVKDSIEDTVGDIGRDVERLKREVESDFDQAMSDLHAHYDQLADRVGQVQAEIKSAVTAAPATRSLARSAVKPEQVAAGVEQAVKTLQQRVAAIGAVQDNFRERLLDILLNTPIEVPSLRGFSFSESIIMPAIAGSINIDIAADFDIGSYGEEAQNVQEAVKKTLAEIKTAAEQTLADIAADSRKTVAGWAEEMGASIRTIASPDVWRERLDSVMTQLEVEFNGDMSTLKNLVSPEGAKSLVTDFGAAKSNLFEQLDPNSYVSIVRTAIDDVVLPNPELYYTSFEKVVEGIAKNILDKLEALHATIKTKLTSLDGDIASRVEDALANLADMLSAAKDTASADNMKRMVKQMANEMWRRVKSQLLTPIVDALRAYTTQIVRRVLLLTVEQIVGRVVEAAKENLGISSADRAAVENALATGKTLALAAYTFAMSEKSVGDIITLVKAIYGSIPEQAKQELADLMPSIPDSLVGIARNMDCEADINNLFAAVTLLDLSKLLPKDSGSGTMRDAKVDYDLGVRLQMLMSVEDYAYTVGEASAAVAKTTPSLAFRFNLTGNAGVKLKLGDAGILTIGGTGGVKNLGFCLTRNVDGIGHGHPILGDESAKTSTVNGQQQAAGSGQTAAEKMLNALAFITFRRDGDEPAVWLESEYLDIRVKDYPMAAYVGYNPFAGAADGAKEGYTLDADMMTRLGIDKDKYKGFQAGVIASLDDLEFVLKLRNNPMLKKFLEDDISMAVSTYLGYDKTAGLRIGGGAKLHLAINPGHLKIGPMDVNSFIIDAGSLSGTFGSLGLNLKSSFAVNLSAVTLSFEELGLGFNLDFIAPKTYELHKPDFSLSFLWPKSIGIAIDTSVVKGSGIIGYDHDEGTIFGAIELQVIKKFGVSAFVLIDTGEKPGHFFSLATMLSASFSPGIPLGMGFSLTAIGGCLGLNRMIDKDKVRDGVRQGTLASVFFVRDLKDHLTEVQENAKAFFPAKNKQFYFGVIGQISYEPVVKCDFGLLLQLPDPVEVIIVGALKVSAGEDSDKLICINVYFAGGINFDEGMWFDASIVNSHIVGIELAGDMAFRLNWGGAAKGFLLSIGGFHPQYKPEEGMRCSDMKRLSLGLDYKILTIKLETYLAVTSNSFQIGADLNLKIGWSKFGIKGYAGFDALFQFDPFLFMFDMRAGVSVVCGSWKLMSIDLAMAVEGPSPWKASGSAKFWFILIPIKVSFNLTWGKKAKQLPSAEVRALELLLKEAANANNWTSSNVDEDQSVTLARQDEATSAEGAMIVQPFASLSFNQSMIPFRTLDQSGEGGGEVLFDSMDICNNARPVDYNSFSLHELTIGGKTVAAKLDEQQGGTSASILHNDFAPSLYKAMTNSEKLRSPSYVSYVSGFTVAAPESNPGEGEKLDLSVKHFVKGASSTAQRAKTAIKACRYEMKESKPTPLTKEATRRYVDHLSSKLARLPKGTGGTRPTPPTPPTPPTGSTQPPFTPIGTGSGANTNPGADTPITPTLPPIGAAAEEHSRQVIAKTKAVLARNTILERLYSYVVGLSITDQQEARRLLEQTLAAMDDDTLLSLARKKKDDNVWKVVTAAQPKLSAYLKDSHKANAQEIVEGKSVIR